MMQPSHQDPSLRYAKAVTADYYHVAPTIERNRIQQHGLQPSNPMNNPDWGPRGEWERRHGLDPQIPQGVYLWDKPGQAYDYANQLETVRDTPMDVWRVPQHQVPQDFQDPDVSFAAYVPHAVQPELHEGPEHRQTDDAGMPYEELWNNFNPLNLNRTNPDYEQLWNQRVPA